MKQCHATVTAAQKCDIRHLLFCTAIGFDSVLTEIIR